MSIYMVSQSTGTDEAHATAPTARSPELCRYYSRTGSCRAGTSCPFLHERASGAPIAKEQDVTTSTRGPADDRAPRDRRQAVKQPVPASRIVAKPVPQAQAQDPREFQLGQIRRRFNPKESVQQGDTVLKFSLTPSDPDFAFDLTALECLLSVPAEYPKLGPSLAVGNKDIPRGFALNVEHGFENLVRDRPGITLLESMKSLDKNLEAFLSAPKAETVKLVPNKDTRHISLPSRTVEPDRPEFEAPSSVPAPVKYIPKSEPTYTAAQKSEALKRRELETRQLESRMGRLPLFHKSGDGIAYTLPIEPGKRSELPAAVQAIKSVKLFVPSLYPLQPCRIRLDGIDEKEARPVEKGFSDRATEQSKLSLMVHVNYLAQNMHTLAKTALEPPKVATAPQPREEETNVSQKGKEPEVHQDPERSHIQYIARPLEWTMVDEKRSSDSESDSIYSYDTDSSDDEPENVDPVSNPVAPQEKGTAISFPFIELYNISLLTISLLNITVKCERCKEVTTINNLKPGVPKTESCRKCATQLGVGFRGEFIHANAVRGGFLDLEACSVIDLLPSTFIPTCAECSTEYTTGIISVRGETTTNVCRECHKKFTFQLPEVKFLRITAAHLPPATGVRRKKDTLGLTPGTELPKRGRCKHYTKSYRWFRFSCCQRLYACDKCHDSTETHAHEWANRMVCGWCSREGHYRPEDCGFCHRLLMKKSGGGGFWEGGKGTRDRVRMSRKDKRKFRRPGGGAK